MLSPFLMLLGCGPNDSTAVDTGGVDGPITEVTESGTCYAQSELSSATPIAFEEIPAYSSTYPSVTAVVRSQAELDALEADFGLSVTAPAIDFSTHQILISYVSISSTCGADPKVQHVVEVDGIPHLSVEVTNPEGTCYTVCDMIGDVTVAVVVEKGDGGSACARLRDTCR